MVQEVDKQMRSDSKNQFDNVLGIQMMLKKANNSVDDLVDNNFMTNGPGNESINCIFFCICQRTYDDRYLPVVTQVRFSWRNVI